MGPARCPRWTCTNGLRSRERVMKSLLLLLLSPGPSFEFVQVSIYHSRSGQNLQETDVQRKPRGATQGHGSTQSHTSHRIHVSLVKPEEPGAAEGHPCWDCHVRPGFCSSG